MTVHFMEGFGAYANGSHYSATDGADPYLLWDDWGNEGPLTSHPPLVISSLVSGDNGIRKYATMDTTDTGQFK